MFSAACGYLDSSSAWLSYVVASSAAHAWCVTRLALKDRSPSPITRMRSRGSKGIVGAWFACCWAGFEVVVGLALLGLLLLLFPLAEEISKV